MNSWANEFFEVGIRQHVIVSKGSFIELVSSVSSVFELHGISAETSESRRCTSQLHRICQINLVMQELDVFDVTSQQGGMSSYVSA